MKRGPIVFTFVATLVALGAAGYFVGHDPWRQHEAGHTGRQAAIGSGPIIYYRDPDGPFFSPSPKKNAAGKDYVAVRASEDVSFDEKPWAAAEPTQQQSSGRRILYYRNPMGLPDTSPVPKKDPMGMDYVPVYEDEAQDGSTVTVSPGKLQRTGVRSETVERRALTIPVRAAGRVDFDPRRTSVVALRFEGFIDSVQKVAEGDYVRKGQSLMRVYGPDLSSAAAEYVAVLNSGPRARVEGARRRLVNLGLDDATIASIARSRRVPRVIDWPAPQDGHVIERTALSGMRAAPGETLFRIVDHSLVWVLADVPERDVSSIKPGETAIVRVRAYPDRPLEGRIAIVYPHLNMETRTARVRIELPNPGGLLLGDMFADVEIEAGGKQKVLAVPESAVIDAGKRQVVILDKGEGRFQPREVKIGRRGEGFAEIASGLAEGDRVVTTANFLIDAESNLKAALQALDQGAEQMIGRLIAWSARNLILVFAGTVFAVAAGVYSLRSLPLDAIPDLSDVQAIVYTEYPGQAPQVVEDQVTYPLASAMLTVPRSKVVRGFSFFGVSFVYVIFEDGVDVYWARSRVLEFLSSATKRLPAGVTPVLGPDATGVGWVYQYALIAKNMTLAELRSLQDWTLRYGLAKAEGVAEVASVGGFVRQYNVVVDPNRLRALDIPLSRIREVIRANNADVGGRTVELSEFEFIIRGRGYLKGIPDLENIVLKAGGGTPLLLKDVARVELGPDERRGVTELNGEGEVVSGIVLQRYGANALTVIDNVKAALAQILPSLPKGVEIVPVYDRSELIYAAIETLRGTLAEESVIVALVCVIFLLHFRSALVAIIMLPVGVLMAFTAMKVLGLGSNIMSLGGIAIAIGAMVDAAIVMIENAHKRLERASPTESRVDVLIDAATEVGPALFFSLLIITVSFLPIFALESQEGRLFSPLAFTKTFAMAAAALLSVTLVPALMVIFVRGKIVAEERNPINRALIYVYRPIIRLVMRAKIPTVLLAIVVLGITILPARQLGSEFMPALNEGALLYMPTTLPGLSVTKAAQLLQTQDRIIKSFPEVKSAYGKAGRASTATDPAPLEMFETIIELKPKDQWRSRMTLESLVAEMDKALQFPGVSNAWTMPIRNRIDMLATGIRTPVGVKVMGRDLGQLELLARQIEKVVKGVRGASSAYAERVMGGYYLDITPDRPALARYGLMIDDVQATIATALGGEVVTTTVEGRERYGVNVRYPRDFRSSPRAIASDVLIALPGGGTVPLGEIAKVDLVRGPTAIRTENGQLAVYIYVDVRDRDIGGFVNEARQAVAEAIEFPPGAYAVWSGQFEYLERAEARMRIVVPVTLFIIFVLLYLNFRTITETLIVMLSLPFALVGGIWLMWIMNFNMSVAVGVGFIALAGVAAETGVIMLIYLDAAMREVAEERAKEGKAFTKSDLHKAIMLGAVERVRPKMMTVVAIMAGLFPIFWSTGAGSEVMKRIAAPMIGGMVSSTVLTLVVIPAIYALVKGFGLPNATSGLGRTEPRSDSGLSNDIDDHAKQGICA